MHAPEHLTTIDQRLTSILRTSALKLLLIVAAAGCSSQQGYSPIEVGQTAPSFSLKDAASGDIVNSDSMQGEVIVVAFWSTSCPNCIREMDELERIHASARAQVVGIALDDDPDRVISLAKKKNIDYQILMGHQEVFDRFDGFSIPYTIILDRNRKVRKKFHGRMTAEQFEEVYQTIQGFRPSSGTKSARCSPSEVM